MDFINHRPSGKTGKVLVASICNHLSLLGDVSSMPGSIFWNSGELWRAQVINTLEMKIKKKALGELGMFSLEKRRIRGDLFFLTVINRTIEILLFHQRIQKNK